MDAETAPRRPTRVLVRRGEASITKTWRISRDVQTGTRMAAGLVCCLLEGKALEDEKKKAAGLKQIEISSRAKGDLIMMGIGGFSPLTGFMDKADWKSVCEKMLLADGTFWPVPVTLDISAEDARDLKVGQEVALVRTGEIMATMKVEEIYEMTEADKKWECELVFKGEGPD